MLNRARQLVFWVPLQRFWLVAMIDVQGHASPPETDNGRLVSQVSSLSEQLHAAHAATAAAQQEAHHLKHKQQVRLSSDSSLSLS